MKKKKFLINCMCCLALAVGTGGVSTMASDLNVEFTADEGNAVDDTDISAFSEGEEIGDDATQPQDIERAGEFLVGNILFGVDRLRFSLRRGDIGHGFVPARSAGHQPESKRQREQKREKSFHKISPSKKQINASENIPAQAAQSLTGLSQTKCRARVTVIASPPRGIAERCSRRRTG